MANQVGNKFTWVIVDFSSLKAKKCYSDPFVIGGCKWRVLVFPKGNGVDHLSLYLDVSESGSLPRGWRRHAKFRFAVVNQLSEESSRKFETEHQFCASEADWGFTRAVLLSELCEGFLVNDKVIIETEIDVLEVTGKLDVPVESEEETNAVLETEEHRAPEETANGPQGGSLCQQEPEFVGASQENSDHAASSPVSYGGSGDTSSQWELVHDSSETVLKAGAESNSVAPAAAKASDHLLEEPQPENETVDVNGFPVLPSQAELVRLIFERHPDMALDFRPKSRKLRSAYMEALVGLVESLCVPLQELNEDDLTAADNVLSDLTDGGFEVEWLKKKLQEVSLKKKKEKASKTRITELEEELRNLKQRLSEIAVELLKERGDASAARVPLTFQDIV